MTEDPGRDARVTQRAFARVAATEDGARVIAFLKAVSNWDEAGPASKEEGAIYFWTGQRSIVKAVLDQAEKGKRLLGETEDDEP